MWQISYILQMEQVGVIISCQKVINSFFKASKNSSGSQTCKLFLIGFWFWLFERSSVDSKQLKLHFRVSEQIAGKKAYCFKSKIDFYNLSRKWFKVKSSKLGHFAPS